ncbi:YecA family protein, partial [Sinorhizobium meliloti]
NRISASLAETPKDHRPRFTRIDDQTFDAMDWDVCFLMGTGFAPKLWRPVVRGHAVTGDIIAPIRKLSETKGPATHKDAAAVAEALVNIRSYFMPKRAKQKF